MKRILASILLATSLLVAIAAPISLDVPGSHTTLSATPSALALDIPNPLDGIGDAVVNFFTDPTRLANFLGILLSIFNSLIGGPLSGLVGVNQPLPASDPRYLQAYGMFGVVSASLDATLHPQGVSTTDYLASIHPITQANALGVDQIQGQPNKNTLNGALKMWKGQNIPAHPILSIWQFMRNLAYGLFVVILVVIGFMIMFRSRLNPRAVVTATSAIPGLILSLILITFSFALAGFMVDIMNVLLQLIHNSFDQWVVLAPDAGIYGIINFAILPGYNLNLGNTCNNVSLNCILYNANPANQIAGGAGALLAIVLQISFRLAAIVIVLLLLFKLIIKWITFLLLTIFSPFYFLLGAIPGRSGMYLSWLKASGTALLTFPAVLVMLYIAVMMDIATGLNVPEPGGNFLTGGDVGGLLVLGMLFLASRIPEAIEHAFDTIMPSHIAKGGFQASQLPIIGGIMKRGGG